MQPILFYNRTHVERFCTDTDRFLRGDTHRIANTSNDLILLYCLYLLHGWINFISFCYFRIKLNCHDQATTEYFNPPGIG